jgi:ribose 5-phosphate isomerase B
MLRVGFAADHGGFELKNQLIEDFRNQDLEIVDFGANEFNKDDDYPDFVIPLAEAVGQNRIDRGIAICGSGVGACIAANKVEGVRAGLIHDIYSAHQGVEDDDMNVICLGGRVVTRQIAGELVKTFLGARFKGYERFRRRLDKIDKLINKRT